MKLINVHGAVFQWFGGALIGARVLFAATSPVADAAMRGDLAAVIALIEQKSDINAKQVDGATAMQWAAYRNDLAMAEKLISAGANVKTPNREGATPLSLASIKDRKSTRLNSSH